MSPIADAFVLSTTPAANYGDATRLVVEEDVTIHHSYLRFDVPSGTHVLGATLRLHVTNASNNGGAVYTVTNNYAGSMTPWSELGIHWDNAPAITGIPLASTGAVAVGDWVEFDVSAAVTGSGTSPIASNDAYVTPKNGKFVMGTPGVLGNDFDADVEPMTVVLMHDTAHGVHSLRANGSFTYTPQSGFEGIDSFDYAATDASNGAGLATVVLNVRAQRTTRPRDGSTFDILGSTVVRWNTRGVWEFDRSGVPIAISFDVQKPTRATLDVFDVSGRRIRHLTKRIHSTGHPQLTWNGRNTHHRRVAAGVYFARLTIDNKSANRRIVILR